MSRTRCLPLALGVTLALCGGGVAAAATFITPPAGTPDLASAALQIADLAPGAVAGQQGYVTPPSDSGFTADYEGDFTTASTADGVRYDDLTDAIALGPSTTVVDQFFGAEQKLFGSKKGHKVLARIFVRNSPKRTHAKLSDVTFSPLASAGIGSASFAETITYKVKHTTVRQVVVAFEEGDAYGAVVLSGELNEALPQSDGVTLATAIDTHLKPVLGATGTSGTTGTT